MFHIGQDVVCIRTYDGNIIKEGNVYTIIGLKNGHCLPVEINVGVKAMWAFDRCTCGKETLNKDGYWWFNADRFKPLDELSDISELLEVLNKENYQKV